MTEEETRAFICPHCFKATVGKVAGLAVWDGYDESGRKPIDPPSEFALVQCGNCRIPSLQVRDDYGGGFDEDEPAIVYPAPRRLSWDVPEPLRREWEEARLCFDNKAYTAAVVMVRRTLEGTCQENGVKEKTLSAGLRKLKEMGLIDSALADWADELRLLGNQGAHYTGQAVSREDADDALGFAEALLDHLYVLKKRFEAFKARRASRAD